jgi:hypothetical protein
MNYKLLSSFALTVLATFASQFSSRGQGTAFTYQGQLIDGANRANGIYDLQFALYNAVSGPGQQGVTLTNTATVVSNGVFTVTLNFGNQFSGASRWLEMGVRTNGGAAFATLTPRQQLTPTPYATYAASAGSAAVASNVTSGVVVSSVNTLKGDVVLQAGTNVSITPSGNTLTIASAGAGGSGIWSLNGTSTYYNAGGVGIGTATPRAGTRLEVNGAAVVTPTGPGTTEFSIGTPNGETGISIIGNGRADIRFDNSTLKLVAGLAGGPPSSFNGIAISTNGTVGVGTTVPGAKLDVAAPSGYGIRSTATGGVGSTIAVYADANGVGKGVFSTAVDGYAVFGQATGKGVGVYGSGTPTGFAGFFQGDVAVNGNLGKASGSFKIDHPLDPANKFLYHSFVESPDMMNVYNGNIVLDDAGEATVQLPDWFQSLNKDFRYQLTSIGGPGPNLYVAEEVADNHFKIAGGRAGAKVSWQVTGVRQDVWANAHRIKVEEEKPESQRGTYLHPELDYGLGDTNTSTVQR